MKSMATTMPGVFAGGEAARGLIQPSRRSPTEKKAAAAIDTYLGGSGELNKGRRSIFRQNTVMTRFRSIRALMRMRWSRQTQALF
jgi:hypothetical protein